GDFQIATQNGEIARSGGIITGGDPNPRRQQGSILAREREWRELPGQISALEGEIKAQQTRLDQIAAAQEKINQTLNRLAGQKLQAAQQQAEAQKEAGRQQTALDELRRQIEWHKDLHAQAERELEANRLRQTGAAQEIERVRREQTAAQEQVAALRAQIAGLSAETLLANLNQAQTNVSLSHEKQQSRRELLKTFTHTLTQTQSQLDNRRERAASLAAQKETLLARLQTQKQAHTALLEAIKSFTGKIEPAEASLKTLEADQQTAEAAESKQRQLLRRLEAEHSRLSLDMARRQDDMDVLHRQIEDDFGLVQLELSEDQVGQPVLPLQSVVTQLPTVEQLPDGIEEELRRLKVHMRQLGHINHDAPREYEESLERYNFLTGQMEDLETAAADLKTVIEELDKLIEAAFMETFVAVAEEFQNYFKILFNGGEAQLVLTNPQDITATGVDIVARPPGKRAQNLELLSGGERSLTAQALIFALLKTSPTPYCVFDEVDAMLDEANVDRFRQALLALGRDIQFIIITHNRKTIEIADTIYGISMGNDAVSRVVSLKLEDIPEDASELLP
ncbi:MAG: hypothetical protein ACE5G8_12110, partial [Anaerolineae bacterium]